MNADEMPLVDRLLWHACFSERTKDRKFSEIIAAAEFFFAPEEVEAARQRAVNLNKNQAIEEVKP